MDGATHKYCPSSSWFKRRHTFVFEKLQAHKFDQLHWIPINWYLFGVCVQHARNTKHPEKFTTTSFSLWFIVLKCRFNILFINCVCARHLSPFIVAAAGIQFYFLRETPHKIASKAQNGSVCVTRWYFRLIWKFNVTLSFRNGWCRKYRVRWETSTRLTIKLSQ